MPRCTAYFQEQHAEHVTLPDSQSIEYSNGELIWTGEKGDAQKPASRVKDEEIIFVTDESQGSNTDYLIFCLKEKPDEAKEAYRLSVLRVGKLPQEILDRHLLSDVPEVLKSPARNGLHVIVSTRSGTGLAQSFYDTVLQPLFGVFGLDSRDRRPGSEYPQDSSKPWLYDLLVTQSSQSIGEFAGTLWEGSRGRPSTENGRYNTPVVVLLSGDGGVVDLLNGGHDTGDGDFRPTIALLPLGTGNALFHSLHKAGCNAPNEHAPSPLVLGLRTLFRGVSAPLPTFRTSFSPGAKLISYPDPEGSPRANGNAGAAEEQTDVVDHLTGAIVASYGFHSQLVWESDTPEYRKHGDKRFGMVAQELLKTSHAYRATVEIRRPGPSSSPPSWVRLGRDRFNYVLAAAVSNLEKTFTISPASRPLDGRLRLVHFGAVGGARTMEIMMRAYDGGAHVDMAWDGEGGARERVGYDEVDEVRVTVLERDARWRKVCIDGTIVEVPEGGWMSVRRTPEPTYRVLVDRSVL